MLTCDNDTMQELKQARENILQEKENLVNSNVVLTGQESMLLNKLIREHTAFNIVIEHLQKAR